MEIKYPKNKSKQTKKTTYTRKTNTQNIIAKQQLEIAQLKADSQLAKLKNTTFESDSKLYDKAYSKAVKTEGRLTDLEGLVAVHSTELSDLRIRVSEVEGCSNGENSDLTELLDRISEHDEILENHDKAIIEYAQKTKTLQTNVSDLQTNVATNTSDIANLQQRCSNIETTNAELEMYMANLESNQQTLQEQQNTNTQNIQALQTQVNEQETNILAMQDNIGTNNHSISQINQELEANAYAHQVIQSQIDQNKSDIEQLKKNGSTGGSADLTEVNQKINDIEVQQDINTQNISKLLAFKDYISTPTDTNYNPKTYSDYPAGTIVQTYAMYERELEIVSFNYKITTPNAHFLAEPESAGTIKVQLNVKTEIDNTEVSIETYLNDAVINTDFLTLTEGENVYKQTIYDYALNAEARQNRMYMVVKINGSASVTATYAKIELLAPNADIIQLYAPFNVEYFDGEYYVSDCTSGFAKLAKIHKDNMVNMQSLQFEDLRFETPALTVAKNAKAYESTYYFDKTYYVYYTKDNVVRATSPDVEFSASSTFLQHIDWHIYKHDLPRFMASNTSFTSQFSTINANNQLTHSVCQTSLSNSVKHHAVKFLDNIANFANSMTSINIDSSGNIAISQRSSTAVQVSVDLGYGTSARAYYYDYISRANYKMKVFIKRFDKIVLYDIKYTTATKFDINSITEIGSYEDFFLGAKNDYFAVKGNKLSYHFFPEETETTE